MLKIARRWSAEKRQRGVSSMYSLNTLIMLAVLEPTALILLTRSDMLRLVFATKTPGKEAKKKGAGVIKKRYFITWQKRTTI
jgi:hypothetical protein